MNPTRAGRARCNVRAAGGAACTRQGIVLSGGGIGCPRGTGQPHRLTCRGRPAGRGRKGRRASAAAGGCVAAAGGHEAAALEVCVHCALCVRCGPCWGGACVEHGGRDLTAWAHGIGGGARCLVHPVPLHGDVNVYCGSGPRPCLPHPSAPPIMRAQAATACRGARGGRHIPKDAAGGSCSAVQHSTAQLRDAPPPSPRHAR